MSNRYDVLNYEYADQSLMREKKTPSPPWETKVRDRVYNRVAWSKSEIGPERIEGFRKNVREVTFDEVFEKKVERSVLGQFLDETRIPANREVREAMIEILEYDWKSFTMKQWKKFASKNDFITNPLSALAKAVVRNEKINSTWLETIVTALRLIAAGITKISRSLKRFTALRHLSLGGNDIKEIKGQDLPPDLRVLELAGNRITCLEKLAHNAPKTLVFLGLSRNNIFSAQELQSLASSLNSLKVLDLEDNELSNLADVIEALKSLKMLRALILEGNPCSTCLGYKTAILMTFTNLIYLDNVVIKPSDRSNQKWIDEPEQLSSGIFYVHVYRIFHLEQPPKSVKKEKFRFFFEVDLPLFDAHLILREEMESVREEFAKTGVDLPYLKNGRKKKSHESDSIPVTAFRAEEFDWKESLAFNEPTFEIPPYGGDLRLLSETFKSVVTVRLVRQKSDERRKSQDPSQVEQAERTVICEFTCTLKNMSWADRSQDFSWSLEEPTNIEATSFPTGVLTRANYGKEDLTRGGKLTKSLNFSTHRLTKQFSNTQKELKSVESVPIPKTLTIQIGFGLRRYPDFEPIEISLPSKGKK